MYKKSIKGVVVVNLLFFTGIELLAVMGILHSIPKNSYTEAINKAYQVKCTEQLRQIGMMIQMYELNNDRLPNASFFPKDPKNDSKSIVRILSDAPGECFICPCCPDQLRKYGLTYIWNDSVSGKPLSSIQNPSQTWLMAEVQSIDPEIPKPHSGGYNILYADLQVRWSADPPPIKVKEEK